ncbi:hypothetical protein QQF45_11000 [Halopseudomonas aestusnigri]|uniref:hypothetical protein n=1 Tax=Halopseudomonas aestusnigri TaxID=857252 RepID=UPI001E35C44D|nr:hypothetical protein [Halopseudomonas aestusnigri]MCK5532064.1 hypothetical protein [Halopseudomonas aestusnigri]MDL2199588.1 hypothetical protein [Halopseudomonas aestusnigri]MEE2799521.1 hypothetical protein [Pseudomonadota bacterium]UGV32580.1 hypothetical protein LO767_09015 [Halopseudomonas aestusnigri]
MSPLLIGGLLAGGLIILVCVGFISHSLERNRLERARQVAELNARIKLSRQAMASVPGQFMPPELAKVILEIETALLERLCRIGKSADAAQRLEQTRATIAEGKLPSNPVAELDSEAKGKEARLQLENLFKQLQLAEQDRLIDNATFKQAGGQVRRFLISATLDTFNATAKLGMQQGKPRVAKLQYERAIAFITRLNNPGLAKHLEQYKRLLQRAEAAVVEQNRADEGQPSELTAGLAELESEDAGWQKKAVYDD